MQILQLDAELACAQHLHKTLSNAKSKKADSLVKLGLR